MNSKTETKNKIVKPTRLTGFIFFLTLTIVLYSLIHYSVLLTLKSWWPFETTTYVIISLWILSIGSLFVARKLHHPLTTLLYRIGVTWMGIAFLLFLVFFPLTMLTLLLGGTLSVVLIIPTIIFIAYTAYNARNTRIEKIEMGVKNLPKKLDGFTIAHLTDLHIGEIYGANFLERIVNMTNKQKPDLVLITGDVFDGGGKTYSGMITPLKELKSKNGVFYVRGNHDVYEGIEETNTLLKNEKVTVLDDEIVNVAGLNICALSYPVDLVSAKREILENLSKKAGTNKPKILLRHEPKDPVYASELGFDVMLSGHTHNGQIWPLSYLVSLAYPYRVGKHRIKQMTLYIGPGVGTWGPPFRLGSRSEITLITLRSL